MRPSLLAAAFGIWACARPPASAPVAAPRLEITAVPRANWPAFVGRDARGLLVTAGSWRARVGADGAIEWSADAMPSPIIQAAPLARGWGFVSDDGVVARSETFLGKLERLGELPPRPRPEPARSTRRSAPPPWIVAGGRIWSFADRLVPLPVQPGGRVRAVRNFGAAYFALLDGGGLAHSTDRGRTWTPVDVGGRALYGLDESRDNGLRVLGGDEPQRLAPDGTLTPSSWEDVPPELPEEPWMKAVERDAQRWMAVQAAVAPLVGPGGSVILEGPLRAIDPATGRLLRDLEAAQPEPDCRAEAWGPTVGLACKRAIYRLSDAFTFERVLDAGGDDGFTFSDDGRHVARLDAGHALAIGDARARAWRPFPVTDAAYARRFMSGDRLALFVKGKLVLLHGDSGRMEEAPLEPRPGPWRLSDCAPRDGSVALMAREREGPISVAVRAPDGAMTYGVLPADVTPMFGPNVCFLDARRGFAAGMTYGDFVTTEDGGRTWRKVRGRDPWLDALTWPHHSMGDGPFGVECRGDRCASFMWDEALIFSTRAPAGDRARVVAPPAGVLDLEARAPPMTAGGPDAGLRLVCQAAPATSPPAGRPFANGVTEGALVDAPGGRIEIRWSSGTTGPVPPPREGVMDRLSGTPGRETLVPLVASPSLLLLLRCELRGNYEQCEVLRARKGGITGELLDDVVGLRTYDLTLRGILPVTGGALLHLRGKVVTSDGHADWLVLLRGDGTVGARRAWAWATNGSTRHSAVARHEGREGLAVEDVEQPERWQFLPFAGGPAEALPPVRLAAAVPCGAGGGGAATELHLGFGGHDVGGSESALTVDGAAAALPSEVTLRVTPAATCWSDMTMPLVPADPAPKGPAPTGVARLRGALEGEWRDGVQRRPLVCRQPSE